MPPADSADRSPQRPLRIGLTGGVGSGKSTVANLFSALGAPVIDTDAIAHDLVEPGQPALARIVAEFGETILNAGGRLDRQRLSRQVFQHAGDRRRLEGILHPLIRKEVQRQLAETVAPYCLLVVPLLIEAGFTDLVDRILVVDAEESEQIRRTKHRSKLSEGEIRNILAAQTNRQERLDAADDVIRNTRDLKHLEAEVAHLHAHYLSLAQGSNG